MLLAGMGITSFGFFKAGYVSGQGTFRQPRTVIHVVSIEWRPNVTEAEKQNILEGVKKMAASVPGVKNVWMKGEWIEPRGYGDAFAIEFRDRAAADAYASSTVHDKWNEIYTRLKAASVSIEVTNP
jgi:hypothetical protein